ncbi:BAG family molecular chaperone regulator 8-chloroplastic [Striga hermonthica]|uniref:BAG family molecular chaperone regulator 8-chloroplastic n=1 Tax=Striga hermonthica TaxID=68872 RepID=A0A9N7N1D4_STRHE|nr:BAG family molecular chaperone regulator 8-chloroplastic [Striga hermonthica]
MASHHHHLSHRPTAASFCCCCPPYPPCHHHPPPPPLPPDCHPIYHHPPQPHLYPAQTPISDSHQHRPSFRELYYDEERETQHTIASLLRRIAALESALRGRTSSSAYYLRDAAARTIQAHFRAFLLRRSRTLRQLKDLASIKSSLGVLKSSVTKQILFDYDLMYHQAMELARKLDTVQGGDPMIQDGKNLVKRELVKFMDFMDGFYIERVSSSSGVNMRYKQSNSRIRVPNGKREMGNLKSGSAKNVTMEKLRGLVERIEKIKEELDEDEENSVIDGSDVFVQNHCVSGINNMNLANQYYRARPKLKKSVSFADDGEICRVLNRNSESILEDNDDDNGDSVGLVRRDFENGDVGREVEENEVLSKEDDDGEEDEVEAHLENLRNECIMQRKMYKQGEDDGIDFSVPLPLKMEKGANFIDKRKKLTLDL